MKRPALASSHCARRASCVQCLARFRRTFIRSSASVRVLGALARRHAEHQFRRSGVRPESGSTLTFFVVGLGALLLVARSQKFRPSN